MDRNKLLAKLHILLKQTGAEAEKDAIYASYNVTSSRDMTDAQLLNLIDKLDGVHPYSPRMKASEAEIRAMRSEVLFVLTASPDAQQPRRRGLGIPNDWQVLNPFIYTHGGKRLTAMSCDELFEFKKQLYAMRETGWRYRAKPQSLPVPQSAIPKDTQPLILIPMSGTTVVS